VKRIVRIQEVFSNQVEESLINSFVNPFFPGDFLSAKDARACFSSFKVKSFLGIAVPPHLIVDGLDPQ